MDTLRQDLRYAVRSLQRSRGYALAAIATLAIGIGANTAIFSVVEGVLLRPPPVAEPDRLAVVWGFHPSIGRETASLPDFLDWRSESRAFQGLAATAATRFNLSGEGEPTVVSGAAVTANYFRVLGTPLPIGRDFRDDEERGGEARVAVLGLGFWQRAFAGRPDVVGRQLVLNGVPYTVVGAGAPDLALSDEVDVWVPLRTDTTLGRRNDFLRVLGRLAPGVGLDRAEGELETIAARLEREYPASNAGWTVDLVRLQDQLVGEVRPALLVFTGAVGLVLLIACANVANLMLARMASRSREVGIRAALGASRRRLVRQVLAESVLLATAGGALGLLVAVWGVQALQALEPGTWPRLSEVAVNGRALAFALAVSVGTGLLCGMVPAGRVLRGAGVAGLGAGSRSVTGHPDVGRTRAWLVLGEVALACVLLIGAALLLRSFDALQRTETGFRTEGVLTARLMLPRLRYEAPGRQDAFTGSLLERLRGIPGVTSASISTDAPVTEGGSYWAFSVEGLEAPPDAAQDAVIFRATPEYFRTFGIPLTRGRLYDPSDRADAAPVAVIGEALARRYWPGRDPIGARITFETPEDSAATWRTVVGVVGDVRQEGPVSPSYPQIYLPLAQVPSRSLLVALRTAGEPSPLAAPMKQAVAALDPTLAVGRVATMEERLAGSVARPRVNALLLGAFAATALLLAVVGIYGVIAYSVVQRTREVGVRMALGARREDVVRLVLRTALGPVLAGTALGLLGAAAGSPLLRGLLFGVSATDPITFALVAALLLLVAALASYLPARRATRVDPVLALRSE